MRTNRNVFAGLVLGSLVIATSSSSFAGPGAAPVVKPPMKPLPAGFVLSNDGFATDLYGRLGKDATKNVFFSPASISTALAMTYAGAKGATATEMAKTMHFDLAPANLDDAFHSLLLRLDASGGKDPEMHVANRLFAQNDLKLLPSFTKVTHDSFLADVGLVDFKTAAEPARELINKWVDGQTHSKIQDIIPKGGITATTRLVLVNAIYFKGGWVTEFKKGATTTDAFTLAPGKSTKAPTMHQQVVTGYGETADAQILSLPYHYAGYDHATSMVVVLPKTADGLGKLEAGLDGKKLAGFSAAIGSADVVVSLPKWKATIFSDLSDKLASMGMPTAFDEKKADFSGITSDTKLFISKVLHKAFVEVDEAGTTAAAATAVIIAAPTAVSEPMPTKTFKADHPFLFYIRDDSTGAVLFMGRIADPTAA